MSCHATKLPDDTQSSSLGLQFLDVLTAHTNTIIPASFGKKKNGSRKNNTILVVI